MGNSSESSRTMRMSQFTADQIIGVRKEQGLGSKLWRIAAGRRTITPDFAPAF
jgi:hypothetical protein